MHVSQNQLVREGILLSRINVVCCGKPASAHDVDQFRTICILRYGLELDLLQLASIDASLFRREVVSHPVIDLELYFRDVKMLKEHFISTMQVAQDCRSWRRFKHGVAGGLHYRVLLPTLAKLWDDPRAAYQWICFDERAGLDGIDSDEEAKYVEWEQQLSTFTYPPELVDELTTIIREWFSDFSFATAPLCPKFGPGATATLRKGTPVRGKLEDLAVDQTASEALGEWFFHDPEVLAPGPRVPEGPRVNKIFFVPKNALRKRVISAEPTWLTWYQQLLKQALYPYVSEHRKMFTWFEDQSASRQAARQGSIDASMATIDFSSASDSITAPLVDAIFAETCLQEPLALTRSVAAELPSGRILPLKKFAPMGSATCFFVLDVTLLAACEASIRHTLGRSGKPGDYVVYGDDVVIRTDCVDEFLAVSQDLHMTVNRDKSYWSSTDVLFREACGGEYLAGVDITPLRYSRFQEPLMDGTSDPAGESLIPSVVSLCNRAYTAYGYESLRKIAYALLQRACSTRRETRSVPEQLLRVDLWDYSRGYDGPLAFIVPDGTATNYKVRSRWNNDLQRREVEVYHFGGRYVWDRHSKGDELLLEYWYHAKRISTNASEPQLCEEDPLMSVQGTIRQKWRKVWFGW